MSLPASQDQRDSSGRWETIRYACDSNARTIRLCVITLVLVIAPMTAAIITALMEHVI